MHGIANSLSSPPMSPVRPAQMKLHGYTHRVKKRLWVTAAATEAVAGHTLHTVQTGETLAQIALAYGVPVEQIQEASSAKGNRRSQALRANTTLPAGAKLVVPSGTRDAQGTSVLPAQSGAHVVTPLNPLLVACAGGAALAAGAAVLLWRPAESAQRGAPPVEVPAASPPSPGAHPPAVSSAVAEVRALLQDAAVEMRAVETALAAVRRASTVNIATQKASDDPALSASAAVPSVVLASTPEVITADAAASNASAAASSSGVDQVALASPALPVWEATASSEPVPDVPVPVPAATSSSDLASTELPAPAAAALPASAQSAAEPVASAAALPTGRSLLEALEGFDTAAAVAAARAQVEAAMSAASSVVKLETVPAAAEPAVPSTNSTPASEASEPYAAPVASASAVEQEASWTAVQAGVVATRVVAAEQGQEQQPVQGILRAAVDDVLASYEPPSGSGSDGEAGAAEGSDQLLPPSPSATRPQSLSLPPDSSSTANLVLTLPPVPLPSPGLSPPPSPGRSPAPQPAAAPSPTPGPSPQLLPVLASSYAQPSAAASPLGLGSLAPGLSLSGAVLDRIRGINALLEEEQQRADVAAAATAAPVAVPTLQPPAASMQAWPSPGQVSSLEGALEGLSTSVNAVNAAVAGVGAVTTAVTGAVAGAAAAGVGAVTGAAVAGAVAVPSAIIGTLNRTFNSSGDVASSPPPSSPTSPPPSHAGARAGSSGTLAALPRREQLPSPRPAAALADSARGYALPTAVLELPPVVQLPPVESEVPVGISLSPSATLTWSSPQAKQVASSSSSGGSTGGSPSAERVRDPYADPTLVNLKCGLLDLVYGTARGVSASSAQRAGIEEFVTALEARNPNTSPTDAVSALSGRWKLVYTSNVATQLLLRALDAVPLVDVGDVYQVVDAASLTATNKIDLAVPLPLSLRAEAGLEVRSPGSFKLRVRRVGLDTYVATPPLLAAIEVPDRVQLLGASIDMAPLRQLLQPINAGVQAANDLLGRVPSPEVGLDALPLPPGVPPGALGDAASLWLLTTYLDDSLRISRDDEGRVFVMLKDLGVYPSDFIRPPR